MSLIYQSKFCKSYGSPFEINYEVSGRWYGYANKFVYEYGDGRGNGPDPGRGNGYPNQYVEAGQITSVADFHGNPLRWYNDKSYLGYSHKSPDLGRLNPIGVFLLREGFHTYPSGLV